MRSNIILFGIAIICLACQNSSESDDFVRSKALKNTGTVSLNLDANTSFEFQNVRYFTNDTLEWLFTLNLNTNGLNIYDLKEEKLVSQFSVPLTGPNALPEINGMTVISPDSIFIYQKMILSKINVVNYKGETLNQIRIDSTFIASDGNEYPAIINQQANTSSPTIYKNNKLYFTRWPNFALSKPENISGNYFVEGYLDLNTLTIDMLPVSFPKWMQNKGWNGTFLLHGKTMNEKGEFIYNFQGDDSLTVHRMNGEVDRVYAGLSGDNLNKEPISNKDKSRSVEELITTTIYWGLVYDKYRKLYYRMADKPINFMPRHRSNLAVYQKPLSVIILNEDFEKVGETDLPEDTYILYGHFVGKEGLYIPRLNPEYEDFSEDQITYSIYQPFDVN